MSFSIFVVVFLWHCDPWFGKSEALLLSMSKVMSFSVVLIGMPGAGKSTIGRTLALQRGVEFVDTDRLIEEREGQTLQALLDRYGYLRLRAIEADVLQTSDFSNKVVATGGSAVYSEAAMNSLRKYGPSVFIDIPLTEIVERVKNFAQRGIAGPPGQDLSGVYTERRPLYLRYADIRVDGSQLDEAQLLAAVVSALADYPAGV
ncbi:shikimate kinase [Zhongshania sp. BJYM1]|uniref:shikimate kinase n=1 Tax=Zhongshania aquatica TaxID=2965069 RepID=UPI0022B4B0D7|nr:shikimate kinase [Marortus sp. BJYM1]